MITDVTKSSVKIFLNICKKEIPKENCYFVNRLINMNGNIFQTSIIRHWNNK